MVKTAGRTVGSIEGNKPEAVEKEGGKKGKITDMD